ITMDDKHKRRFHAADRQQQYKDIKNYVSRFFSTQRQSLLTGALLLVIIMLLFGIVSQLQPPPDTTPHRVTVINYGTFVEQVKARNVLAVILQGNAIHGLLASP